MTSIQQLIQSIVALIFLGVFLSGCTSMESMDSMDKNNSTMKSDTMDPMKTMEGNKEMEMKKKPMQ